MALISNLDLTFLPEEERDRALILMKELSQSPAWTLVLTYIGQQVQKIDEHLFSLVPDEKLYSADYLFKVQRKVFMDIYQLPQTLLTALMESNRPQNEIPEDDEHDNADFDPFA